MKTTTYGNVTITADCGLQSHRHHWHAEFLSHFQHTNISEKEYYQEKKKLLAFTKELKIKIMDCFSQEKEILKEEDIFLQSEGLKELIENANQEIKEVIRRAEGEDETR